MVDVYFEHHFKVKENSSIEIKKTSFCRYFVRLLFLYFNLPPVADGSGVNLFDMQNVYLDNEQLNELRLVHTTERNRNTICWTNTVIMLNTGWKLRRAKKIYCY